MTYGHRQLLATLCLSALSVLCHALPSLELLDQILNKEPNAHLQTLGTMSDAEGSLARTFMSPAHKRAAEQLKAWILEAGMEAWVDVVGNVHGRLNGSDPSLPMLVVGSHYDTVLDAGKYDGPLGIITGIAAIKMAVAAELQAREQLPADWATAGIPNSLANGSLLRRTLRLVAFSDEEGVRFQSTFLGSRALAGTLVKYGMLQSKDKAGLSLAEVLQQEAGVEDVEAAVAAVALDPRQVAEYVEVHIEQGPVLERKGVALGVVSAIAGQTRLWVSINGTQGHAGTVPMRGRADSLAAAAGVVALVERRCGGGPGGDVQGAEGVMEGFSGDDMLVCTVGELRVWPGASNVIAGNTQLSIDIRSKSDALRARVVDNVTASIEEVCTTRGTPCSVRRTHDAAAVLSDEGIVQGFADAIRASREVMSVLDPEGGSSGDSNDDGSCSAGGSTGGSQQCTGPPSGGSGSDAPIMVSGAGHDAMALAEITKMGMLFVRCRGGISHNPLEHTQPLDVAAATAALYQYIVQRASS